MDVRVREHGMHVEPVLKLWAGLQLMWVAHIGAHAASIQFSTIEAALLVSSAACGPIDVSGRNMTMTASNAAARSARTRRQA